MKPPREFGNNGLSAEDSVSFSHLRSIWTVLCQRGTERCLRPLP